MMKRMCWLIIAPALAVGLCVAGPGYADQSDDGFRDPPRHERGPQAEGGRSDPSDELGFVDPQIGSGAFADGRPGLGRPMSPEQLMAAQRIVDRVYPELGDRLNALREQDPERYRRTLERRLPRVRYLVELRQRDPKMFELRISDIELGRQSIELAERLHDAEMAGNKDLVHDLRHELERKITKHFDIRQDIREREIDVLRDRLEVLEDRLDDRDDDRDDLIEQRLRELTGSDDW